jgi:predicted HAD superfamily hydrolase
MSNRSLEAKIETRKTISWDLFDTLIYRSSGQPDLAKFRVGEVLHKADLLSEPWSYLEIRNKAEEDIRASIGITEDVTLKSITKKIVDENFKVSPFSADDLATLEFEFDLQEMLPRPGIIDVYNKFSDKSTLITDIYYSTEQVETILKSLDLKPPVNLYVSASTGMRKDRGDIWKALLIKKVIVAGNHIHLGDNEFSDNQIPSDLGIDTVMIPSAIRSWTTQFYKNHGQYPKYPTLHEFLFSEDIEVDCAQIQSYFACPLSNLANSN